MTSLIRRPSLSHRNSHTNTIKLSGGYPPQSFTKFSFLILMDTLLILCGGTAGVAGIYYLLTKPKPTTCPKKQKLLGALLIIAGGLLLWNSSITFSAEFPTACQNISGKSRGLCKLYTGNNIHAIYKNVSGRQCTRMCSTVPGCTRCVLD